ncbi:MAG: replicative DNA helicase [Solidesulfovibrio sp.]|uniref:replicative DNA helicase n=1 Tax=Solidesulfovibrio sp. TaxID=2910990 RepID=UPI0031585F45
MVASRRSRLEPGPADLSTMLLRNVPPHNREAEQAVLGGVLLKPSLLDKLVSELRRGDFYDPRHQLVWEAMAGLWRGNKPVDLVTLAEALAAAGSLEKVGGAAYLAELSSFTISAAHALHHAGIMRGHAKRRAMLDMGRRMIEIAYDPERDPSEFVGIAQLAADAVLKDRLDAHGESPAEFLDPYTHYLERLEESGGGGVATPFWKLNALIRSFMPGEMIVIGARPSHGKTALALTLAEHAVGLGHPSGIFSLEMAKYQLLNRIFSSGTGVAAQRFRDGKFSDDDWARIYALCDRMRDMPLRIYDKPARKPSDIRATCRRWRQDGGLDIVFIDYAQLIPPDGHHHNREQEIASISRSIKLLAEDLALPVVLLAQVNREVAKRKSPKLVESDLRESGAIEQDADIILLIQPWDRSGREDIQFTQLTVAKSRNSMTGDVPVAYNRKNVRFEQDDRLN